VRYRWSAVRSSSVVRAGPLPVRAPGLAAFPNGSDERLDAVVHEARARSQRRADRRRTWPGCPATARQSPCCARYPCHARHNRAIRAANDCGDSPLAGVSDRHPARPDLHPAPVALPARPAGGRNVPSRLTSAISCTPDRSFPAHHRRRHPAVVQHDGSSPGSRRSGTVWSGWLPIGDLSFVNSWVSAAPECQLAHRRCRIAHQRPARRPLPRGPGCRSSCALTAYCASSS